MAWPHGIEGFDAEGDMAQNSYGDEDGRTQIRPQG